MQFDSTKKLSNPVFENGKIIHNAVSPKSQLLPKNHRIESGHFGLDMSDPLPIFKRTINGGS